MIAPPQIKCSRCGTDFEPVRKSQRFCGRQCQNAANNHPTPTGIPTNISPEDQRIIDLYEKKVGSKAIAKILGVENQAIRRKLKAWGLLRAWRGYKPHGEGIDAIRKRQRAEALVKGSQIRSQIAACLRGLRAGVPLRTTMRNRGWRDLSGRIYERASYQKLRARIALKKPASIRCSRVSLQYPFESLLQKEAALILGAAGVQFVPEARVGDRSSRSDFKLADGTVIECKVDTIRKHCQRLIGQLMTYKFHGAARLIVLLPDDVRIDDDLRQIIFAIPADIQTISEFRTAKIGGVS